MSEIDVDAMLGPRETITPAVRAWAAEKARVFHEGVEQSAAWARFMEAFGSGALAEEARRLFPECGWAVQLVYSAMFSVVSSEPSTTDHFKGISPLR